MAHWRLDRRDRIAVATFSAPPRNSMRFADMTELEGLVEDVARDDSVTVLVLGSDVPGWFVLHGDLEDLVKLGRGEPFEGDALSWPRTLARFGSMRQIVVAAINGQAGGGGLEMTLACTLRVVGPRARLTLVEVALGLIPGGGGTQRLPRLIGPGRAAELILSGRAVGAEEAVRLGIAERFVPDEPFLDGVLRPPRWLPPSGRSWMVSRCRSTKGWRWRPRWSGRCSPRRPRCTCRSRRSCATARRPPTRSSCCDTAAAVTTRPGSAVITARRWASGIATHQGGGSTCR